MKRLGLAKGDRGPFGELTFPVAPARYALNEAPNIPGTERRQ